MVNDYSSDIKSILNYLNEYKGKKYKKAENSKNEAEKEMMNDFKNSGQKARALLIKMAEMVIDGTINQYEISRCTNWINMGQVGSDYLWLEFKQTKHKMSQTSISLVVSVEDYYPTPVSLSVEIKDKGCSELDYIKHNRIIYKENVIPNAYYIVTYPNDCNHHIATSSREKLIREYEDGKIKKIKLQLDLENPYLDLVNRIRTGIKLLEPYYLVAVSDYNSSHYENGYDEVTESGSYYEGAVATVKVNKFERNLEARLRCIRKYGTTCQICGFNFKEVYGDAGEGLIHVHHIIPISTIGEQYQVNPEKDLIPVCPNCHAMIHRRKEPYGIEEIRHMIQMNK